jgi:hypothetical protein
MARKARDLALEINTLIDRGFYLAQEATELNKQLTKISYHDSPVTEPLRRASNLLSISASIGELARKIIEKAQLEEHRAEVEKTLRARVVSGGNDPDV